MANLIRWKGVLPSMGESFVVRVGRFDLVRLRRDAKDASLYVDDVLRAIRAMSDRFGPGGAAFLDELWRLYALKSPLLGLWAAVADGRIVGHLVATVQLWDGEYVGWVHQAETELNLTHAEWDGCLAALDEWTGEASTALRAANVAAMPIKRLILCTPHPPAFFTRRGGFRVYRTIMDRQVKA